MLAGYLYDITGSYTLPFAIPGSLLFPAGISADTIKEGKRLGSGMGFCS